MIGNILFSLGLIVAAVVGFVYCRDLGDDSQMVLRVKRKNIIRFIRNEYRLLAGGLSATALMILAYPEGTVFLNKPSSNPLLRLFDMAMDTAFTAGIVRQHNEAKPLMNNMTHSDDRLPNKTYVWGVNIGEDARYLNDHNVN